MIKSFAGFALATLLLAGCASNTETKTIATVTNPNGSVTTTTVTPSEAEKALALTWDDLEHTRTIAQAQTPQPDQQALTCVTYFEPLVKKMQANLQAGLAPVGFASTIEELNVQTNTVNPQQTADAAAAAKTALETACAPIKDHILNKAVTFAAELTTIATALGLHLPPIVLPALAVPGVP